MGDCLGSSKNVFTFRWLSSVYFIGGIKIDPWFCSSTRLVHSILIQFALISVIVARLVFGEAAIKDSPSYAPQRVNCPAGITIRRTSTAIPLNPEEAKYVIRTTQNSATDWTIYLNNVGLQGLDVNAFVSGTKLGRPGIDMPNVAFVISGGAQRASWWIHVSCF